MCLIALALQQSERFPLVIAANRDEFFDRPAAPLAWWSPGEGGPDILSGRDLQAGGTWLGLNAAGRLAAVTNVREPQRKDPQAPSRGGVVPLWLRGDLPGDRLRAQVAGSGYNALNLLAADFALGECFFASNRSPQAVHLERGLYGVSNAGLDTPWPKVVALKARLRAALDRGGTVPALSDALFEALADRSVPPDDQLPSTGVPLEWERQLASAFIRTPDKLYGTRCSTLVITEQAGPRRITHVIERSFEPDRDDAGVRRSVLHDWPPIPREAGAADPLNPPRSTRP